MKKFSVARIIFLAVTVLELILTFFLREYIIFNVGSAFPIILILSPLLAPADEARRRYLYGKYDHDEGTFNCREKEERSPFWFLDIIVIFLPIFLPFVFFLDTGFKIGIPIALLVAFALVFLLWLTVSSSKDAAKKQKQLDEELREQQTRESYGKWK